MRWFKARTDGGMLHFSLTSVTQNCNVGLTTRGAGKPSMTCEPSRKIQIWLRPVAVSVLMGKHFELRKLSLQTNA